MIVKKFAISLVQYYNILLNTIFRQSTSFDASFVPGWVAFAHSFAFEGENDQAIAAYSTAARLFPG